nr:hypothetical protein Iba_chr06bCG9800 [Ipomoea batatas]
MITRIRCPRNKKITWFVENREAKISGFESSIFIRTKEQKVLGLEISMHDTQRMASLHHPNNGLEQLSSLPFTVMPLLHNPVKELPTSTELHHYVHIQSILKNQLLLGNGLASIERGRGFLRAEMGGPELALTQLLAYGVELPKGVGPVREDPCGLWPWSF